MTPLGAIRYDPKVGLVAKARSWPDQPQLVNGAVLAYESKTYTHNDQTLPKKAAQANLIPEIQGEHKCCAFEQVQEAVGSWPSPAMVSTKHSSNNIRKDLTANSNWFKEPSTHYRWTIKKALQVKKMLSSQSDLSILMIWEWLHNDDRCSHTSDEQNNGCYHSVDVPQVKQHLT